MKSLSSNHVAAGFVEPMKALGRDQVPSGRWHCEIKYDGYRAIAVLNRGKVELWSRARKPLNADYPAIVAALKGLKCRTAVLDGEIVALDNQGRSRFQLLQGRNVDAARRPVIAYTVFDIIHYNGNNLTGWPIEDRRKLLAAALNGLEPPVQLSAVFDVEPSDLMSAVRKKGLEGIVAKRIGSVYEPGQRSGAWIKCKCRGEQELVIGGFSRPQRSRKYFGAILVGYFQKEKLIYAGKVGTGFSHSVLQSLHALFLKRTRSTCPFVNLPMTGRRRFGTAMSAAEMEKVTWLRPDLVAQIGFAEWTDDGLLRQPVFFGLRKDKRATAVRREAGPVG